MSAIIQLFWVDSSHSQRSSTVCSLVHGSHHAVRRRQFDGITPTDPLSTIDSLWNVSWNSWTKLPIPIDTNHGTTTIRATRGT